VKLRFLRPLYEGPVGYVSVYLDTSRAHENAAEAVGLRWRAAREQLAEAGADAATLDAVQDVVADPAQAAPGRAVFAHQGNVAFTFPLNAPPRREIARVAPLPHLMPLLAQNPPPPPHLLVTANRAGGEIVAVSGTGEVSLGTVAGRGWPVHKTSVGGWSQARFQRSAEEAWEENAKELASAVADAASRTHADLILIGGDTRARSLVFDHLDTRLQDMTVFVDQEVPADSPAMTAAAEQAISAKTERETRLRFDEWRAGRAHSGAVDGLDSTLAALRDGQVADLFLADPTSTAEAWIGPDGIDLAVSEAELRDRGVASPMKDRVDAAIVRALATTDAELFLLPEDLIETTEPTAPLEGVSFPRDGVCATLRWADGGRS
jgi:predicted NBD/HSP70 family sugar kinase